MVKKGIQILSIFLFIITFCFVCPFNILAENGTYYETNGDNSCVAYSNSTYPYYRFNKPVRLVIIETQSDYIFYAISLESFISNSSSSLSGCNGTGNVTSSHYTRNNYDFYYLLIQQNAKTDIQYNIDIPIFTDDGTARQVQAYYYTYGDGAVDPTPSVNYGSLITGFYTSFAGSGTLENDKTWRENLDTITWKNYDSNGNDLSGRGYIEIRAVPGEFIDLDRLNLASKLYSDFVLSSDTFSLGLYAPSTGQTSYRWGDIATYFGGSYPDTWDMYAYFRSGYWVKNGWIYQIRLVDKDDETVGLTDWQTIYTVSSVSGDDSLSDPDSLSPELVRTIETVNNNNNTTNNYYYGDTTINMSEDPDDGTGKPWWSYLLEAITSVLNRIIDGISQILSALLGRDINLGDRDIDVNLQVNNYLDDLDNKAQDINVNLPQWQLSNDVVSGLNVMKGLAGRVIDIYNENGILIFILLPILIGILGILL